MRTETMNASVIRLRVAFGLWPKKAGLACAVVCAVVLVGCGRRPPVQPHGMTPEVGVITVSPESVVLTTELPGRVAPYVIAEIRPQVSGLILKRLFVEGSDVLAGQVLYQIDPAPFQAAYDSAVAALARAEANLPAVRARAERFKSLLAEKAVSQQAYDDAMAALQQAEADVRYWKAAVETARINLGYTKVTSPISGRIGKTFVTEGAIVTAYQPQPLAVVQQLDPVYVDVPRSTAELQQLERRLGEGKLKPDPDKQHRVQIVLEDGSVYPHEGTLQFRDVTVDPTTGTVILRIVVPNPNGVLLPGMFVRARIAEGVNDRAILVPQDVVMRTYKGMPFVLVVGKSGMVEMRMVQIDRAVGNKWLVTAGLDPGDRVIAEGVLRVRPGMPVREVPAGTLQSQQMRPPVPGGAPASAGPGAGQPAQAHN